MGGERGQERRKERGGEGKGWEAATQERRPYHAGLVIDPHKDLPSGRLRRGCVRP